MQDKLRAIRGRFSEVSRLLQQPGELGSERFAELMKEYKELTPIAEAYDEWEHFSKLCDEAQQLLDDAATEPELRQLAAAQLAQAAPGRQQAWERLRLRLLPRDADDDRSAIVEIRSGTGGEEAALFAADIYRMYTLYAQRCGWRCEMISASATELGGFKEVCFSVEGTGVFRRMKFESGVHRVQRVPLTESQGRIQTSAVTVAILPQAGEVDVHIAPGDIRVDTFRSSGAGGQHINKTSSAIRITHLPTGLVVECQDERSQHRNREKAMCVLRSRLYRMERQRRDEQLASSRRSQVGSGDRSERIRTYNFPQGRVTDHRIDLTLYRLEDVMNGQLEELTAALELDEQARRLQAAGL